MILDFGKFKILSTKSEKLLGIANNELTFEKKMKNRL